MPKKPLRRDYLEDSDDDDEDYSILRRARNAFVVAKDPKHRRLLVLSYLPDWIVTIVLWIAFYIIDKVHGFRREFSLDDRSIQHTFAVHERVPIWLLAVVSAAVPAVLILVIGALIRRNWWDVHNGLLGLVLSLALTTTTTDIIKVTVGRPRPDLIDRCQPTSGAHDAAIFGLSTDSICTQTDDSKLTDGFRSFPSGHASTAWCGLGFLTLYLAAKLHLFDRQGHAIKAWISLTPLVAAALIAVSRTMDYRHHWQDVTVGSILGFLMAWFSYRLYYPPLSHPRCHKPYSPRISDPTLLPTARTHGLDNRFSNDSQTGFVYPPHGGHPGPEGTEPRPDGMGGGGQHPLVGMPTVGYAGDERGGAGVDKS